MTISPDDFPRPWQKPAYADLIACLRQLRVEPPTWNAKVSRADMLREQEATAWQRRETASYLSSLVSSSLDWIGDEDQMEEIWTEASKRLSERCGRTAMGEITRRWPFESPSPSPSQGGTDPATPFELTIREPPLTGDSLGLKTWGSSYVLAQLLPQFAQTSLSHLLGDSRRLGGQPVLELGSGTGLLGLAAACLWRVPVVLTDLPDIMPNLAHNVDANRAVAESLGGSVEAAPLVWGQREGLDARFEKGFRFKLVIVADPLYDDNHPELLAEAVHAQLALEEEARALIMVPQRDETTKRLLAVFRSEMLTHGGAGIVCFEEGVEPGQDDWDEDDGSQRVDCWWGVFRRSEAR